MIDFENHDGFEDIEAAAMVISKKIGKDRAYSFAQLKTILARKNIQVRNNRQLRELLQCLFQGYLVMPGIGKVIPNGKVSEFKKIKIV